MTSDSTPSQSVPVPEPRSPSKRKRDERLLLSDMTVLECPICFHPLTIPVFQCANGHISCSSCHELLKRKCPTCSKKLGNQRNRAIESVLESIKVSCSYKIYGCTEKIIFSNMRSHENDCVYAPYKCPFTDCIFSGSPRKLYTHLKKQHTSSVVLLRLGRFFRVHVGKALAFAVFLEMGDDGAIFILNTKTMGVSCIQEPKLCRFAFVYSLHATLERGSFKCSLEAESVTSLVRDGNVAEEKAAGNNCPLEDFLHTLDYLLGYDEFVSLWLKVHSKGSSSTNTTSGIADAGQSGTLKTS